MTSEQQHDIRIKVLGLPSDLTRYYGGIMRFDGATHHDLFTILEAGAAKAADTQNDAPSYGEIVEFMEKHPTVRADGYVVVPTRDDCRISIDALSIPKDSDTETVVAFAVFSHGADEFDGYSAWWD